jgi:hypothetical protein
MKLSASIHCTAWRSASGLPNVTRCLAYLAPSSRQRSITPMPRAPWRMRPDIEPVLRVLKPSPSSPMRFSTGTLTSLERDLPRPVVDHQLLRAHSLTPGDFMSTMKAEMPPCEPFERSVAAISCRNRLRRRR